MNEKKRRERTGRQRVQNNAKVLTHKNCLVSVFADTDNIYRKTIVDA